MILLDIIAVIFSLVLAFNFKNKFFVFNAYDRDLLNKLLFYHLFISFFLFFYLSKNGGDAASYWFMNAKHRYYSFEDFVNLAREGSATGYMLLLNYIPVKILGLSFFTGNIMYACLGHASFVYFYAFIKENIPNIYSLRAERIFFVPIFPFVLFLPNLHFWSSGIGKDTLLFFCVALFIYSIQHIRARLVGIGIAILLSIFVRPHIILFLVIAFGTGYMLDGRLRLYQKVGIVSIFLLGVAVMFDFVLDFINLESIDTAAVEEFSSTRASNLADENTGSAVDISGYPYPLKVFTFLYRPLFLDASGPMGLVASFDNLIILLFSLKVFLSGFVSRFRAADRNMKGLFVFFLLGALSFSLILGNFGIMLRQKAPFFMVFVIYGFYVLAKYKALPVRKIHRPEMVDGQHTLLNS